MEIRMSEFYEILKSLVIIHKEIFRFQKVFDRRWFQLHQWCKLLKRSIPPNKLVSMTVSPPTR